MYRLALAAVLLLVSACAHTESCNGVKSGNGCTGNPWIVNLAKETPAYSEFGIQRLDHGKVTETSMFSFHVVEPKKGADADTWLDWPMAESCAGYNDLSAPLFAMPPPRNGVPDKETWACFYMRPRLGSVVLHARRGGHEYRTRWELVK